MRKSERVEFEEEPRNARPFERFLWGLNQQSPACMESMASVTFSLPFLNMKILIFQYILFFDQIILTKECRYLESATVCYWLNFEFPSVGKLNTRWQFFLLPTSSNTQKHSNATAHPSNCKWIFQFSPPFQLCMLSDFNIIVQPIFFMKQVKLGFTRACRSIDELGKKWLKTWQNWSFNVLKLLDLLKQCKMLKLLNFLN